MKMNLLLTAAATACLLSTPATAAMVRIQTVGTDPLHVDQLITHPIYASIPGRAEADLLGGNFKVFDEAIGAFDENSSAAMDTAVFPGFTNMSGQTMNLQPGWFSAHVAGDITLSPAPGSGQVDSTQVQGVLTITHNFVTRNATGRQFASTSCPGCGPGNMTPTFQHEFNVLSESNGATVQLNNAFLAFPSGQGELDMDLIMPAIVLAPGESFTWWFQLKADTNSGPTSGNAVADFFNSPTLTIVLPVGFVPDDLRSLDGRDGSDFTWITTTPGPVPTLNPTILSAVTLALMTFGVVFIVRRKHQQSIARL